MKNALWPERRAFLRKCWQLLFAVMAFTSLSAQDDSARFSAIKGYGFFYKRMGIDSVLYVPLYESAHTPYRAGAIKYRKSDSSFYKYTGTQWLKVQEGGVATNGIDTVYTINDTVQVIETADETYFTIINSPYTEVLNGSTIIVGNDTLVISPDHGTLTGLSDDDHTQYVLLSGRNSGQTIYGGTAAGNNLSLNSTSNGVKGNILFGTVATIDEANGRLGVGTLSPGARVEVVNNNLGTTFSTTSGIYLANTSVAANGAQQISPALTLEGHGWKTSATAGSQTVAYSMYTLPVQGTAAPTGNFVVERIVNGTPTNHPVFQIESEGIRVSTGLVSGSGGISLNVNAAPVRDQLTVGNNFTFQSNNLGAANATGVWRFNSGSVTHTSGVMNYVATIAQFNPTSGSGEMNYFAVTPTINQTGGASGITRGLYVNPTLTSAADFRAIETVSGNVVLNSTSGNTGIGITNPIEKLHVAGNALITGNVKVADEVYGTSWNGSVEVPTKNAIYDKIESMDAAHLDSIHIYTASGVEPDTLYEYRQGDSVLVGYIPKGVDALVASDGVSRNGASIKLGQGQEEDGNPAMLQENRVIPLGFNQLVFRGNSSDSITFTSNSINITADNDGNASIGLVGNVLGIPGNEHWGTFGPGYFDIGGPNSTMQFFSQGSTYINAFDNTSSWGVQGNIMYLALAENSNKMLFTTEDDNATIEFLYSGIDPGDGCKLRATPSIKKLSLEGDLVQINAHLEAHGRIVAQDSITVNNVPTITSGAPLVLNTANGTISQINLDNLLGYKEYVATISQISTNDPVATVLKNTTGTTFTWARSGEGTYTVTAASSLLAANKTVILTGAAAGNGYVVNTTRVSDTVISVVVTDTSDGSQVDEGLTETTFIIRIYP